MALAVARRQGVSWADSFTRANQSALGNGWTLGNGTTQPAISSNTAACTTTTSGYYPAVFPQPVRTDRYYVQAQLGSAATASAGALLIRCNTGMTQQVFAGYSTGSSTSYFILVTSPTAASYTNETSTSTVTWASGNYVTVTAASNVYTLWQSTTPVWTTGTVATTWTDSSNTASTGPAYRYGGIAAQYSNSAQNAPLKNFVMADY